MNTPAIRKKDDHKKLTTEGKQARDKQTGVAGHTERDRNHRKQSTTQFTRP